MVSLRFLFPILILASSSLPRCFGESRKELRYKGIGSGNYIEFSSGLGSKTVDPSRVLQLSWQPRVFFYRGFLTEEECDHLTSLGKGTLEVDSNSGDADGKKQLASSEYVLDVPDPVVAGIEERISAWTFLPRENSHPIKVSRYGSERVGEKLDYLGEKSRSETRDSLLATVILYLSNTTQGGEIHFPESEARNRIWPDCSKTSSILRPIRGNVVLFFTRHLNTSVDQTSIHVRCPVLEGEMWVGTKLFYVRPPPKQIRGTTEQKNSECTDEDESCSRWAALGECLKNPVYMIGTPDYSGACRKSCKAC